MYPEIGNVHLTAVQLWNLNAFLLHTYTGYDDNSTVPYTVYISIPLKFLIQKSLLKYESEYIWNKKTLSTITSHQRSILNKNKAVACYGDFTVQSSQIKQCNILILMPYLLKMFPFALYISSLKFSLIVHLKNERIVL